MLGGIVLRHRLNDFNKHLGHIGYGIRPSARRRGVATWALGRMLIEARRIGLDRVLLVCGPDNLASARTIERARGVPEDSSLADGGARRRYWIDLTRIA